MAVTHKRAERARGGRVDEDLVIFDADTHVGTSPAAPNWEEHFLAYLPQRWRRYLEVRPLTFGKDAQVPVQKPFASRVDAYPPSGGPPGCDPDFARQDLLDRYGIARAVINSQLVTYAIGGQQPAELSHALIYAANESNANHWLASDPRWVATIAIAPEHPAHAVTEIDRMVAAHPDRFVGVYVGSRTEQPFGNRRYWPIFEACAAHDIPVVFHSNACMTSAITAVGVPDYYFEVHTDFGTQMWTIVSSLVFEGVFDRFPNLKVVLAELGWSTLLPFARRMDGTYRVLRDEVPHLQRRPSEYVRDHFWFTTQPIDEPDDPAWLSRVVAQLEEFGMGDRILYSSDYPHWDFDNPEAVFLGGTVTPEQRRAIMGGNAAKLWGAPLEPATEVPA